MLFDEENFIQIDPLEGDPDDEDCSGYTGNEGVSTTHFYHRTVRSICLSHLGAFMLTLINKKVAFLISKSYRIDFFGDTKHPETT